jgi:hypothetical protein
MQRAMKLVQMGRADNLNMLPSEQRVREAAAYGLRFGNLGLLTAAADQLRTQGFPEDVQSYRRINELSQDTTLGPSSEVVNSRSSHELGNSNQSVL